MRITIWLNSLAVGACTLFAQQYTISTIAGGGMLPSSVPALSVRVPISGGLTTGSGEDVYFCSFNSVLKIDASGILTRVAGTGKYGYSGDGGPASRAQLAWPAGLTMDRSGNLFIADNANHRIRKVSTEGIISTVAGTTGGNSGDGGPATNAQLSWPTGVAADASGNLYIADAANHRIRKVSSDGIITTMTADLHRPEGLAVDAAGNLFASDYVVITDSQGDNFYAGRILKITSSGSTETFADGQGDKHGLQSPRGIALAASGALYVADNAAGGVWKISSSGVMLIAGDESTQLVGVAVDSSGNVYFSDTSQSRIVKVSPQGDLANVVGDGTRGSYWGDGGPATEAGLNLPLGVAVDTSENVYIADTGNSRVRKVSPDGVITTIAGTGTSGYSGDGGPATEAQLRGPASLAVDASGSLYIADYLDHRIRKVSPDGIITTTAGNGRPGQGFGPWGDGGRATSAELAGPFGVAVDAGGNVYVADTNHFSIRKVSATGTITTVAGRVPFPSDVGDGSRAADAGLAFPTGVTVDAAGTLYITADGRVRKVSSGGIISTVAGSGSAWSGPVPDTLASGDGGPATRAPLHAPFAATVDADYNVYISGGQLSGFFNGVGYVRKVTADGSIATIAGNGASGYSGEGGQATAASFGAATAGIAVGVEGTIYVADVFNNVIRVLRVASSLK
jgi:trimeric autotransporter adhesin